jgi:alcohol dehydrogenase
LFLNMLVHRIESNLLPLIVSEARTTVHFGRAARNQLPELARKLGARRVLLVADQGMVKAGYAGRIRELLESAGAGVHPFHGFGENPDTAMVEHGRAFAAPLEIDLIVALGGGSSMDCAKAINFVLTNGGDMRQYRGHAPTARPMLPMIALSTTTGTGSEAQSHALISDAETHVKMACGAPGAAFRAVILDPELAVTQPRRVLAASGYDAISHAVESFVTTRRNAFSGMYAREAWRLLSENFERALASPDLEPVGAMQLGAYFAGAAIEHSMLGATHACANPLTAEYGTAHGEAIALLLPAVVAWNSGQPQIAGLYRDLDGDLPGRLAELRAAAGLASTMEVPAGDITKLVCAASEQWTGKFNPRPFDASAAEEIYRCVLRVS